MRHAAAAGNCQAARSDHRGGGRFAISCRDAGAKLEDYFRLPSVRHYLILKTENRTSFITRGADGIILTRIVREGPILLDPPGITLTDCFPPGAA